MYKREWRKRSHFLLSVKIPDDDSNSFAVPVHVVGGRAIHNWDIIGDRVTDLAALWYGKRFDNHGLVARGPIAIMPDLSSLSSFIDSELPPFNPAPRPDLAIGLNLNELRPALGLLYRHEPAEKTNAFWTATRFYANALRVFPADPEMAFLHLVVALEIIASQIEVPCHDLYDEQTRKDLENIAKKVSNRAARRVRQRLYQIRRRVVYAAKHLVSDVFFEGTQAKETLRLTRRKLESCVKAAYDLRSKYAHGGAQFGIWFAMHVGGPTAEVQMGSPVLPGSQKELEQLLARIPTFVGLERLVRFVLLRFAHCYIDEIHPRLLDKVGEGQVPGSFDWLSVWRDLQSNLARQPSCPDHPEYPHVRTLARGSINDIIRVGEDGVTVRSHQTFRERFVPTKQFEAWWNHLTVQGSASLTSRSPNIPRTGHARVVGAIMAACLPERIKVIDHNTIALVSRQD